ncbi:C-type lectin domain family 4 member G-like [Tamandua tetradactyla]|uniref:C-type lectin domain family 4 member G-like n=1 Tax=Tamandua tetradactyla TaxID=48850 RepID=UPI0040543EE2
MKEEDEEGSWVNPKELTAVRPKPPPRPCNAGRWGQKPPVETWKYVCLTVALTLLLLVALLSLLLPPVLRKTEQVQEEATQLKRKVTQGLADAGHDRDFIRGEMFRQVKSARVGNESFCQSCPQGWRAFQGSCYFFSTNNLTWTQANESCFQEQAHLVIINSKAEQEFLAPITQVTLWIGLFRKDGGTHRWSDGSAPTYSNRDFEEPPDNGTHSTCVMMLHHGHWKDFPCELESSVFICEKRQSC